MCLSAYGGLCVRIYISFQRLSTSQTSICYRLNFAAGFFGVQQYQTSYHQTIEVEDDGFHGSLDPSNACPNANNDVANLGFDAIQNWTQIYLENTVSRLQKHIDGVELEARRLPAWRIHFEGIRVVGAGGWDIR